MANLQHHLFILLSLTLITLSTASTSSSTSADFVKTACTATLYPSLCVNSLSGYAAAVKTNDHRLALAALSVSHSRAVSAKAYVSKLARSSPKGVASTRDHFQAVRDCAENMGDSVDRLTLSIKEFGKKTTSTDDFIWRMSNVQTWVSAALTDDTTCTDGLSTAAAVDERVKKGIKAVVSNASRVTSNALALVNRFAEKRQAHGGGGHY